MYRSPASLTLVLFLSATAASSQQPATSSPSVAPAPAKTAPKSAPADYSKEDVVIEQYLAGARFENDGTGEESLTLRVRVQSEAGVQRFGELVFGYNSANERLEVLYVRVDKADGSVKTAGPDAVKNMTSPIARDAPVYTDTKEEHVTVPALRPGDTLEYSIATHIEKPLSPGQFWYEHDFSEGLIVLDERLELNLPKVRTVRLKTQPGADPEIRDEGDRRIYLWKRANLTRPPEEEEKKKPERQEAKPPAVQLTTFTSWEEVAKWYAELEHGRSTPTPELRAKAQSLTANRKTQEEKIEAIYDYVAKNIRYVSLSFGRGRYQPHPAAQILANQYGDCKDKHTLLAAMLDAVGISSDAVLIPSKSKVDPDVPSPLQFDHVITAVPEAGSLLWMDSTTEVAPFRLLTPNLRAKQALLVAPDGAGKLVETPADPPFAASQRVEIEGRISALGKLTARLHYVLRGDNEFALRTAFRRTPQSQWKQIGETIATLDGFRGEISSVKPSDPADTHQPFELEMEYSQVNFLDWSAKSTRVAIPLPVVGLPETSEENTGPIKLGSPLDVDLKLKLELPENDVARAPVAMAVMRDYAEYRSTYKVEGRQLDAERILRFKMHELPADRTGDYLAFSRAVDADEGQPLAVESTVAGVPAIPASAKVDEISEAGAAALNSGNPRAAIDLFQRVVELEPKHKHAWDNLGLAYLRLAEWKDAAAAFRKQLEVDPYDQNANNYLGLALGQLQKYDEATSAFRKQIELNPLDPIAHASLGELLIQLRKYTEAVPELEKATVLNPDNAVLQVSLGQAYLNTGKQTEALAAFDKAAQISPTPAVWNNVAYDLAQSNLHLERAQQYAESAVEATATSLRNVSLEGLSEKDLENVAALGTFWDTLGWVRFKRGDLDAAEKFIRASWLLDQHAEVGDHLAQIYRARGQKDLAIGTYAEALAAPHQIPETRGRLASLLGGDAGVDALVDQNRAKLVAARTFSLGKSQAGDGGAEFFVLLAPGPSGAAVAAVKFISGSENLRPLGERLRSLPYGEMFPSSAPTKLVRRGKLSCSAATGECSFVLLNPEDVRTIN